MDYVFRISLITADHEAVFVDQGFYDQDGLRVDAMHSGEDKITDIQVVILI